MAITKFQTPKGETRYRVTYRVHGKQFKRVARTKKEAQDIETDGRNAHRSGQTIAPKRGITLGDMADSWRAWLPTSSKPPKRKTLEAYDTELKLRIDAPLRRRPIASITTEDVEEAAERWRRDGVSDESIRKALTVLSKVYDYAAKRHKPRLQVANPVTDADRPTARVKRQPNAFTDKQLALIAKKMPDKRDRAMLYFLACTGLRIGEGFGLRLEDVTDSQLRVRRTIDEGAGSIEHPKGGKERTVQLTPAAQANLSILAGDRETGYVYASGNVDADGTERPANIKQWRKKRFQTAAKAAGFDGARPHDLRHTYASHAIHAGASVLKVQEQMGHARASITLDRYSHLFAEVDTLFVDTLGARMSGFVAD
jgi:integrase